MRVRTDYDDISPFTGNKKIMKEFDERYEDTLVFCMDSGYQTYENLWREGSENIETLERMLPNQVLKSKKTVNGNVWYKMPLYDPFVAMFPQNGSWVICPLIAAKEDDTEVVLSIEQEDEQGNIYYLHRRIDEKLKVEVDGDNYTEALDKFNAIRSAILTNLREEPSNGK